MSKYLPLWNFIANNSIEKITFEEIENVLGFKIDHSFLIYKSELKEFGFEISKISIKEKFVLVKRLNKIGNW